MQDATALCVLIKKGVQEESEERTYFEVLPSHSLDLIGRTGNARYYDRGKSKYHIMKFNVPLEYMLPIVMGKDAQKRSRGSLGIDCHLI